MEKKYHIYKDGHQITGSGEEMSLKEIDAKHGVKKLNNSGHIIKPIETIKPMNKEDSISGGRADSMSPKDFDTAALKAGTDHEMEHTDDRKKAREIAMDHLAEDPKYYIKLKDIEKYDRVDEEADGKKELDYGKEELDKRWKKLKKALSSNESIMEIASQEYQDEDEQSDESTGENDISEQPEQEGEEEPQPEQPEEELQPEEGQEGEEEPQPEEGDEHSQLEDMLREEGYSDAEVAYIVHNHMMPQSTVDDIKMDGHKAKNEQDQDSSSHDLDHTKRMNDLEFQQAQKDGESDVDSSHKQRMNDLEYDTASQEQGINDMDRDHKKRMLDLEYETAQKEKEMELSFKEKEMELKLQGQKDKDSHSLQMKKDTAKSRQQDAAKTSKKEKAGK